MIETDVDDFFQALAGKSDAGSNQVCVETCVMRSGDQVVQISARQRLASRQVHVLEKATSVRADDCGVGFGVLLLQFRDEFCERALAIAQLQNSLSRALNPDGAFRK